MRTTLAILVTALSLSACGLKGRLERPVPLWGNPPNEGPLDPRSIKAAEEKAKADKEREAAEKAARDAAQTQPTVPMPNTPQ